LKPLRRSACRGAAPAGTRGASPRHSTLRQPCCFTRSRVGLALQRHVKLGRTAAVLGVAVLARRAAVALDLADVPCAALGVASLVDAVRRRVVEAVAGKRLEPIERGAALDLITRETDHRHSVRHRPKEKSARVRNLFTTGLDEVEKCRAFDRIVQCQSNCVIIIEIRRVSKVLHLLGDLCQFGRNVWFRRFVCSEICDFAFARRIDLATGFSRQPAA
jgi:hypothetical protein